VPHHQAMSSVAVVPAIPPAARRRLRRNRVERLAGGQDGVLHRRQLYAAGITRSEVKAELRAGRWIRLGRQSIGVGPGGERAQWFRAVFEVGADAALDGSTALMAAGLGQFEDVLHVSVSKGHRHGGARGVRVHETRRRRPDDVLPGALPTVRPAVAAVRAALWAGTDRQAALVLAMSVQQRIVRADDLWAAVETIRRDRRRSLIRAVVADVRGGAESLGELEFGRLCRRSGLPTPDRQSVVRTPQGRYYLDCRFERFGVVVEIDGVHHMSTDTWVADALRQNELTIRSDRVLRVPLLGLRVQAPLFVEQLRAALRSGGWNG
jgi:hypothetical protein